MAAYPSEVSAIPPHYLSSAKLLLVCSVPYSGSLMKRLNSTGPSLNLRDITLEIGLQLGFVLLVATTSLSLAVQPVFNPLYYPLTQSVFWQYVYKKVMANCQKPC